MNVVLGGLYSTLIVKEKFSGVLNSEKNSSELFMEHLGKSNLKVIQVMPQVHNILKVLQQFGQLIYC